MGHFNGPTPKRHRLWSNCKDLIDKITEKAGFMSREEMGQFVQKTAVQFVDVHGVKRHTGNPKVLQKSQPLDCILIPQAPWTENPKSYPGIVSYILHLNPPSPREYTKEFGDFLAKYFVDVMQDCPALSRHCVKQTYARILLYIEL